MAVNRPLKIPGKRTVITKKMIEDAIKNSKSNSGAARWVGVAYNTYMKYAKFYGLWEKHINQAGVGIKKGWGSYRISLDEIFNGRKVSSLYTKAFFKRRLIGEGYLKEECNFCK